MSTLTHRSVAFAIGILVGVSDSLIAQALPNATNKPTLNYLTTQHAALLFGGYGQDGVLGETWLLQDGCWQQLPIAGPPARATHATAYDAARGQLVLFGGLDADNTPLGDTWIFDGVRWHQRRVAGPPARSLHRMSYDAANQRVLLFGGRVTAAGPHLDDTWAWDGASWREVTRGGPPARFESAMAYHTSENAVLLFGGNRAVNREYAAGALGDTWLLRNGAWSAVFGAGPGPRDHHAMAHHAARGVTVLFGGFHNVMLGDTWLFDAAGWRNATDPNGPSARGGVPAITYDSDRRKVVMYGGWGNDGALRDLWEWDGSWTRAAECAAGR
jgi:hypothetical protein